MPVQCANCKAHLSVRGLTACAICRHPLPADAVAALGGAAVRKTSPSAFAARVPDARTVLGLAALAIIAVSVVAIGYRIAVPAPEQIRARLVSAALLKCQQAIVGTAQYGDAETPPFVPNHGTKDEFYFAWPAGQFHFANAFGARVKMSASCVGNLASGEITQLTVNGVTLR